MLAEKHSVSLLNGIYLNLKLYCTFGEAILMDRRRERQTETEIQRLSQTEIDRQRQKQSQTEIEGVIRV